MSILSSLGHGLRLARAAYVFAREGAFLGVDPALLPPVARLPLALANLIAKRNVDGLDRPLAGDRSVGAVLRQARTIPLDPPRHCRGKVAIELERLQDRVAPMSRETAIGIIEALVRREDRFVVRELRRARRGGLDRPSPPRRSENWRRHAAGRGESAARRRRTAICARSWRTCSSPPGSPRALDAGVSPVAAGPGRRDPRPLGSDGDGFPARSRGGVGIRRKFQSGSRRFARRRSTGTAPRAK